MAPNFLTAIYCVDKDMGVLVDDVNDKLRRNVVLVGAAIIASYLFGLRFAPGLQKSGEQPTVAYLFDIENKSSVLIWAIALTVLTYVYFRYRLDEKSKKGRGEARNDYASIKLAKIKKRLKKQIYGALYKNSELLIPYSLALQQTLLRDSDFLQAWSNRCRPAKIEIEISDLKFNNYDVEIARLAALAGMSPPPDTAINTSDPSTLWTGSFTLKTFELNWDKDERDSRSPCHTPHYSKPFPFHVAESDSERICISSAMWFKWKFFSKSFVDIFIVEGFIALIF